MIFIIDDDEIMAECIAKACKRKTLTFSNAITAMDAISKGELPCLIFLDILLDGPDGFTFLHELVSYPDTASIPIIIISSLNFKDQDLSIYNVVEVLDKTTMTPQEITKYVDQYCTK